MGGMPASSQGKIILYLPPPEGEVIPRSILSFILMHRRGCKVIPVTSEDNAGNWKEELQSRSIGGGLEPFILEGDNLREGLNDAVSKLKAWGVVYPSGPGEESKYPIMHTEGAAISHFYPTISMDVSEVEDWTKKLNR
jgi:hypothetical protein